MNKIIVENDTMRFYSTPVPIPVGGSQWSKIFFMFSDEWEDLRKIAQFRQGELKINVDIDSNNFCYVPNEMLPDMCGELSIVGYPQDTASAVIATANSLMLNFVQGFESGGEPAVPPTPDLYQKLLKEFAESGGGNPDAVLYSKQELTDKQQKQARVNIGAGQPVFVVNVTGVGGSGGYTADKTAAEIEAAYQAGRTIVCKTQAQFLIGYIPVELPLVSRNQERVFIFAVDQLVGNGIFAITVNISDSGIEVSNDMVEVYNKPVGGIPKSDLADDVQTSLAKADTAISYDSQTLTEEQKSQARTNIGAEKAGTGYSKPTSGIPKTDLADDVQTSLDKADTAISYNSQTLTEEQQKRARENIGALPERAIENFWSKDHSTRDIRDMLVEYRYGVISQQGDDCNINGVIINREIMFPCMVLSLQYYTDQIRNLVILDGAGRTLDITVHSNSGVLAYRWHQPILRTWTDEQEPI